MSEKLVERLLKIQMRDDEGLTQGSGCGDRKGIRLQNYLGDRISKTLLDVGSEEKQS